MTVYELKRSFRTLTRRMRPSTAVAGVEVFAHTCAPSDLFIACYGRRFKTGRSKMKRLVASIGVTVALFIFIEYGEYLPEQHP